MIHLNGFSEGIGLSITAGYITTHRLYTNQHSFKKLKISRLEFIENE